MQTEPYYSSDVDESDRPIILAEVAEVLKEHLSPHRIHLPPWFLLGL